MKHSLAFFALLVGAFFPISSTARSWTLSDCINYAQTHNITLLKSAVQHQSAIEDLLQSKAELKPSVSAQTSQNLSFNPWPETGSYYVQGSKVQSSVDKFFYNGSYGLNLNWTVWNGNQTRNQTVLNELAARKIQIDSAATATTLVEQITQLYVEILYTQEAVQVSKSNLKTSQENYKQGLEMYKVGKLSKADLSQLEAQEAQDQFNVIQAQSNVLEYKRQLKQLLQITSQDEFDVATPTTTDAMALETIPSVDSVYGAAVEQRPEIKSALAGIAESDVNLKIAKAGKLPSVSLGASASANTTSMSDNAWVKQLKNNFVLGAGVTVSIPLFDQRKTKTAVNKAMLSKQSYQLDLQDAKNSIYSNIESYWLKAYNNQNKFKAAQVSTKSAKSSYNLLSEQFHLGLKNIVELMTGKSNLVQAEQNELESKYLAILNIKMLNFYKSGIIK